MNFRKWKAVSLIAAIMVSASFAQESFRSPDPWNAETNYRGNHLISQGDTVSYGTFAGKPLYWWAKFAADGTMRPGEFAAEGGTSPWVMINSLSASNSGGRPNFSATTWNGGGGSTAINNIQAGQARVPTWRDGARGAYTVNLDDIGPMNFQTMIKPALDVLDTFPDIKMSWGVYVEKMTAADWDNATNMVLKGHEMFNHSYMHTSAADQWQIYYPGKTVSQTDPAVPGEVRGLTVVGTWKVTVKSTSGKSWGPIEWDKWTGTLPSDPKTTTGDFGNPAIVNTFPRATIGSWSMHSGKPNNASIDEWNEQGTVYTYTLIAESDLVTIEYPAGWAGEEYDPAGGIAWNDPRVKITPKAGVTPVLLPSGQTVYVKYNAGYPVPTTEYEGYQEGLIAATGVQFFETGLLLSDYPFYYNGTELKVKWGVDNCSELEPKNTIQGNGANGCYVGGQPGWSLSNQNQGRSGFVAKIFCIKGWDGGKGDLGPQARKNIDTANSVINRNIYERIETAGEYFAKGKRVEYYGYPFDAYSEKTHDLLWTARNRGVSSGFVGARGGAKSGQPIPGDFFHPFAIDFDAFYINKTEWTVNNSGTPEMIYPNNPHVLLGLNGMIDKIINANGYMIRELHAVSDLPGSTWHNGIDSESDLWPINNSGLGLGGWWGGITKYQLEEHLRYVQQKIDSKDLTVYTPSEAVKYRMTANGFETNATLQTSGDNWTVKLNKKSGETVDPIHHEEISVIVNLGTPVTQLAVAYDGNPNNKNADNSPRIKPRKMDAAGQVWSVSINPFKTNDHSALLIRNGEWFGQGTTEPIEVSITNDKRTSQRTSVISFAGLQNGQINLRLTAGNYTVSLYNLQGRVVGTANINAVNGINATGLKTNNLAKGMLILRVKDAKGANVLQHKLMIK